MRKLHTLNWAFASLMLIMASTSCNNNAATSGSTSGKRPTAVGYDFTPKDSTWKSLSIREKIGQTIILLAYADRQQASYGSIDSMMKKYPIGGLFIPAWHFANHQPKEETVSNIHYWIQKYEDAAKYPMIITEDFERGMGSVYEGYTDMPVEMSLGAANDPELARAYGNSTAKEASTLGVNWLLHPVSDLNINPLQNLVVERAISDNQDRAYPLLKAQIQGMKDHGTVSTIKHFPGDGATMKNQHLVTSANNMSMSEWNSTYGTLFQHLINDGTPCIMVGHIRFPAYQKDSLKGVLPPASLSKELMTGLLKEKMKFNGVIMSDALNMGGCSGYYANKMETAVASFVAGVDMVLWPDITYIDTVEARINRGEIPMARLDDAVKRIWGVREHYGLLEKKKEIFYTLTKDDKNTIAQTVTNVAEKAVTIVEDKHKELPLSNTTHKKICIINVSTNDMTKQLQITKKAFEENGFEVADIIYNPISYAWENRLDYFDGFDKVIVAFENRYLAPIGSAMLKGNEAMGIWTVNMIPFEKTIAISYSNPYYVNYYMDNAPIRINAYSIDEHTQKAVVDVLIGKIKATATSPVKLDNAIMY